MKLSPEIISIRRLTLYNEGESKIGRTIKPRCGGGGTPKSRKQSFQRRSESGIWYEGLDSRFSGND